MPSWLSPLLTTGAGIAIFAALFLLSAVEPHLKDLVWRRLAGSVLLAVTHRSREEQQKAAAAATRDARIKGAMAHLQDGVITWAAHGRVPKSALVVATLTADVHKGIAELRSEEPRVEAELQAITAQVAQHPFGFPLDEAQALLAAVEAKLRGLE